MNNESRGTLGRNALFLVLTYAATFAAAQVTERLIGAESLIPLAAMMVVQIIAFVVAPRVGARAAGYLVAIFAATLVAEFVIQIAYGVKSLHSAPVHYAVALAAAVGAGFGTVLSRGPSVASRNASAISTQTAR